MLFANAPQCKEHSHMAPIRAVAQTPDVPLWFLTENA